MGTRHLSDYQEHLLGLLHLAELDDAPASLTPQQVDAALEQAVVEHSRLRPRVVTDASLDGTGSATQFRLDNLAVPYEPGFSQLLRVEHPLGSTPPAVHDPNTYAVVLNASGQTVLWFLESTPTAGTNNVRVDYTARHSLTVSASTLADADLYAVCHLAAYHALLSLAGRAAHRVQPTIGADDAGPRTQADVYRTLAREHRAAYFAHFGASEKDASTVGGASVTRDLDAALVYGQDRLFHPRRWL